MGRTLLFVTLVLVSPLGCQQNAAKPQADPPGNVETIREYWPNGQLKVEKHVLRRRDGTTVEHGLYTGWYDNGQKEYGATYVDGKLDGVETAWHRNGKKRTEQYYQHGQRHGPRYTWDEQGRLRTEENYFDDRPHGTWTIWKEDGSIKWQAEFEHGLPRS